MISLIPNILGVIALPTKFTDIIVYTFYIVLAVLFLVAIAFGVWGALSLERREEAFLKMKGVGIAFGFIAVVAAIFDVMGWSAAIGINFYNL